MKRTIHQPIFNPKSRDVLSLKTFSCALFTLLCSVSIHAGKKDRTYEKSMDRSLVTQLPNAFINSLQQPDLSDGFSYIPADPTIAVGPCSFIAMINSALQIRNKSTLEQRYLDSTVGSASSCFKSVESRFVTCVS